MNAIPWIVSLIFFVSAVLSVIYGKTLVKNRKDCVCREDEPTYFWVLVGNYTFMGFFMLFVGYHFLALL